jgi:hypothetical protein
MKTDVAAVPVKGIALIGLRVKGIEPGLFRRVIDHPGDEPRNAAAPARRTGKPFFLNRLHDQPLKRLPAPAALILINGHVFLPLGALPRSFHPGTWLKAMNPKQTPGCNKISIRMMNIEQGISNDEVGSRKSSLLHWTFDIRYSAVRF